MAASAASKPPEDVTVAQWVDYCTHADDVIIAIDGINDRIINDRQAGIATTYADLLRSAAKDLHKDAVKIGKRNETLGVQIEALSKAAAKTRRTYLDTGKLKFRALEIAANPLPSC